MSGTSDLTAVFYTAEHIPSNFAKRVLGQLKLALGDQPLIIVKKDPNVEASHINIYRQALEGVRQAKTKYVALCEDDVLYSHEHFKYRPKNAPFAYNLGAWSIFTWGEPIFHHKGIVRKNLNSLICERDAFIEAMEERFRKYPDESKINLDVWAEPGRYERLLGVTERQTEDFYTNPPNIVFSHENELSFKGLGTRKRIGEFRAYEIPYWETAEGIRRYYE